MQGEQRRELRGGGEGWRGLCIPVKICNFFLRINNGQKFKAVYKTIALNLGLSCLIPFSFLLELEEIP